MLLSQEPMLLYKYYRLHERFPQAAAYMYQLAQQEGDLNISGSQSRIEYLNLAVNAATTACSYVSGGPSGMGGGLESELLVEIESKHKIANLQYQAFIRLQREYQVGAIVIIFVLPSCINPKNISHLFFPSS